MPPELSNGTRDDHERPAEGERSAVVGFSGQYGLAARIVRAKITTLQWIRVADPDAGVADDFQFQAGGTRYALQVKWAQYPGTFGWAELVNSSKDATPLMGRLALAWQRIRQGWSGPLEIRLWSNENASTAKPQRGSVLASCSVQPPRHFAAFLARSWMHVRERLRDGSSWSQVATLPEVIDWQPAWDALRAATGLDADTFARFVSDLDLHFGPAVDDQLLRPDEAPRDGDLEHLAATLQALVADPARPMQLSREMLFERLGWTDKLRFRNPHAFPVPAVYTANEAARQQLQARLDGLTGGYIALVGPAGAGKSTLLASLIWPQRQVVRYYAFVPDASDPLSGRGEADSFLHDVSLALEGVGIRRRGYGNDLRTQRAVLQEQLSEAGEQWRASGEATVIVVDGLDHIPREQNPTRSLLEELPPPTGLPEGVFVVLGTQTTGILPRQIGDALTVEDRTVELPPLAPSEVLRLAEAAGPGEWLLPSQREGLVAASEGHPLALTYLLQDLAALEAAKPDVQLRSLAVDALLSDASAYGAEVAARYRGYLLAVGDDHELLNIVAAVARLRTPVDLDWLKTWVATPVLEEFIRRTATFFRREGTVWRFIHNSFRRFLIDETSRVAGTFDAERDRELHVVLADVCDGSDSRWTLYRDEEMAHRYLAGDYRRVIELATPSVLRDKILALRPIAVVRVQASLALRAAAETGDHPNLFRMLLFHNELWLRELVITPEKLASVMVDLGPPERALEHVVAAGRLRVSVKAALEIAARYARSRSFEAAAQILRATGSLAEIVGDKASNAADWAEATFHISGLEEVLAQLDDQLPVSVDPLAAAHAEAATQAAEHRLDHEERCAQIAWARSELLARCFDLLSEVRDETGLATLQDRIDRESSLGWRARARVVQAIAACEDGDPAAVLRLCRDVIELHWNGPDIEDDEEVASPTRKTGGVPLSLRLRAADILLSSGLTDSQELDLLVPQDTQAAWPSVPSDHGLTPFVTFIDLAKLRVVRPVSISTPTGAMSVAPPNRYNPGVQRFRRALTTLAELEGRQVAADLGRGSAPNVAVGAEPIVRLLEVSTHQRRDWTGWYYIQDAAPGLFRRLALLAARGGGEAVRAVLDRFAVAWDDPHRSEFWPPQRQLQVLRAVLPVASAEVADRVRDCLDRLDATIAMLAAGPQELSEVWLEQARGWQEAGNLDRAEQAVQSAVGASWGSGIHDEDRQLVAWVHWMRAAADAGVLEGEEFLNAARGYAGRLAAAHDADQDAAEAAAQLIQLVWPTDPGLSTMMAESLCDIGIIKEGDAVEAVLLAAARDPRVPVELAAVAAAELLVPLRRQPPDELRQEIEQRLGPQAPRAVSIIDGAIALWSVPEDPDSPSAHRFDTVGPAAASTAPRDVQPSAAAPVSVGALLTQMRGTSHPSAETRDWGGAVDAVADEHVAPAVAVALLQQARRLHLDGEALGVVAAMAARAGQAEPAAEVLKAALARTPAYGWLRHYDGGSRLKLLRAALRHLDPTFTRLAASDLAGALSTGAISGQIFPADLRRIIEAIAGRDAVGQAWPVVAEYLDVFAPAARDLPGFDEPVVAAGTPVEAFLRWAASYFGHPVRPRDFGARRILQAALDMTLEEADIVLAESIHLGGWQAEAALHTLVTYRRSRAAPPPSLEASIREAAVANDAICRELARQLCARYGRAAPVPPSRPLAGTYGLVLPRLPVRVAPQPDERGIPMIDMHDPQQILGPFDLPLRQTAKVAGLSEEAVLHRAAAIAVGLDKPWLLRGHQAQATRLDTRGQHHTYRPWAFMVGRRALGIVLAELVDGGALEPELVEALIQKLGLIDEVLIHVRPSPIDDTTPPPWRAPTNASYDVRGWCEQTAEAAQTYASATEVASTYVLAESTEWIRLEWGKPEEHRTLQTAHGPASAGGVILLSRPRWVTSYTPASIYPELSDLAWTGEQLVVKGLEMHSDPPWHEWLALHPEVGRQLGWTPDLTELFCWNGANGIWRARTIRRARGQLSHQPPGHAYCAEGWQVVLSDNGLAELRHAFGPLRRDLVVQRTLPARPREDRPEAETIRYRASLTDTC